MPKDKNRNYRLSDSMVQSVSEIAKAKMTTSSAIVRKAIKKYLQDPD